MKFTIKESVGAGRRSAEERVVNSRLCGAKSGGIALITVLLILSLMSLIGLIMVISVSSDMMINGYYGNYRSSFYAADSGLNIARAALLNQTAAGVNMTPCSGWSTGNAAPCNTAPLATTSATTALNSVMATYANFTSLNAGQAGGSSPESFLIGNTATCTNSAGLAAGYPTTTTNAQGQITAYTFRFNYTLCASGRGQATSQANTSETGNYTVVVAAQSTSTQTVNTSFAAFGAFINNFPPCLAPLIPGTMTGPMFTNGAWQFMPGNYIFTDPVGQSNAKADYWFGGTCIQSATSSYTSGSQTIRPTFQQGLNLSQAQVPLPQNSFSQQWAVLDGKGCGEGSNVCGNSTSPSPPSVTNANLNSILRGVNGTAYPSGGAGSGVFLPYTCVGESHSCVNTVTGGGIYVQGSAGVVLNASRDGQGNPTQTYSITQAGTVTTVTTNLTTNMTTFSSGGNSVTLTGVPQNQLGATPQPATMLYVNGTISSLAGPGQGVGAVQDGSQITITANGTVNITGDVIYAHEPVQMNTSNTLVNGNDYNQVLGVFTSSGNINLSSPYSNQNLQVDGSLAAIGQSCASNMCGFTVSGYINTFNNVGGQIQGNIFGANMSTQNTYFDRRFISRPGFAPPWFPSTTVTQANLTNALAPLVTTAQPQRMSWVTSPQ
jgi:Tfp pilus assembly protein PilX